MLLDDFENYIEPKILERGLDYYENGHIPKVEKVSENEFSAIACGNRRYNIYVKLGGRNIIEQRCNCPYDWSDVCKHAVAVFYKLSAGDFTDSAEKLREILGNLTYKTLRNFVDDLLKKDRDFRNEFLRKFDKDFEEDEDEEFFDEDYY